MELKEFVAIVPGFAALSHPDKILHFGWFLHKHKQKPTFAQADIRACYNEQHIHPPTSAKHSTPIAKKPKVLLEEKGAYKLEHSMRQKLDEKYGEHETTIAVSALLRDFRARSPMRRNGSS